VTIQQIRNGSMIKYSDYVECDKMGLQYEGPEEFLGDCLSLLDMFLEESMQVTDRVTSKGFYDVPPCFRRTGGESRTLDEEIVLMEAYIEGRQPQNVFPLTLVSKLLNLSLYEKIALIASLAVECDDRYAGIYSEILGAKTDYPTVALVNRLYRLVGGDCVKEQTGLTDRGGVMAALFFDMEGEEAAPAPERRLRLYEDMAGFLLGDDSLESYTKKICDDRVFLRKSTSRYGRDILMPTVEKIVKIGEYEKNNVVVLLNGQGPIAKQTIAELLAERNSQSALMINTGLVEDLSESDRKKYVHKIRFASLGTDIILLYGSNGEKITRANMELFVMKLVSDLSASIILVDVGDEDGKDLRTVLDSPAYSNAHMIQIESPDLDGRTVVWREALSECRLADDVDLTELAEGYELSYDEIIKISADIVKKSIIESEEIDRKMIRNAINESCSASFGTLAQRLRTDYTWDDICIEESQKKILVMACERYMHRNRVSRDLGIGSKGAYGNGVSVLLYGPPGTGKTMAAQIVANEVGLPLFRVDLSQLSSKYIGETQKNLSKVFDEAAKTNVILFFDEADSVFAKRTEVESSNDKYSNSDSAFLLQKLESYSGFVILATNLFNNFDNAFVRRITYACSLISPDEKARIEIFKTSMPDGIKADGQLDYEYFGSHFELSGSNIRSIVTSAVYMSRIEGVPISNRHLAISLCYEYRKLGKMIPVSDLGPYGIYVRETM